jgi:uncharacterized C2H2 Zn-finger protein
MSLLENYLKYINNAEGRGEKFLVFKCPYCRQILKTSPDPGDTFSTCPYCLTNYFKITHQNGIVTTKTMSDLLTNK